MLSAIQLSCVAAGGAFGALARHISGVFILRLIGTAFPYGTLFVNVIGSSIMGVLSHYFMNKSMHFEPIALMLTVGFLGAFTTYSTFSVDTIQFFINEQFTKAFLNIFFNTTLCIGFAFAGMKLSQHFVG